jgi:hypothetical protein
MAYVYEVRILLGQIDTAVCPPPFLDEIFPNFDGQPVEMTEQYCRVTFDSQQTPVDLSPLIKVKLLSE